MRMYVVIMTCSDDPIVCIGKYTVLILNRRFTIVRTNKGKATLRKSSMGKRFGVRSKADSRESLHELFDER